MNYKTIQYIIRFLLGDDVSPDLIETIGYTADRSLFHCYHVVIIPSDFFKDGVYGHPSSIPALPLQEIDGVPLLFGTPKEERVGDALVIYSDIIASTYFLITRYEEMLRRDVRDDHGRFPGKESLPYRAGFIHRPIIDEYRILLRHWLQCSHIDVAGVKPQIRKIYLTHDIDAPFRYRSWKGFIRSLRDRGIITSIKALFDSPENDPYYTFPFIFDENSKLKASQEEGKIDELFFLKAGGKHTHDKPVYRLKSKGIRLLINDIKTEKGVIGLHASYQSGIEPSLIPVEAENLSKAIDNEIVYNRHHFLTNREPEHTDQLEVAKITDDFSMGYADVSGFRLGTSYPVRWINPVTRRLSNITLHPLTIMDCTLDENKYMGLDYDKALDYSLGLISQTKNVGGELVLLWHNTSFCQDSKSYHRRLYHDLLTELAKR